MAIVLLTRPAGLFGEGLSHGRYHHRCRRPVSAHEEAGFLGFTRAQALAFGVLVAFVLISPFFLYPVFLMKVLCFALFACAFNLLIGYVGLLSFGHAAFFRHGRLRHGPCRQGLGL
jgi:branched-chain amino acid transport system permease protein